jgi:hypothetical protein
MSANRCAEAAATPAATDARRAFQTSGSSTLRRTHRVNSAGRIPTKKTARQPQRGSTKPTTTAAAAKPMAHALCMKPNARPRCAAGQVSDTSAAPLAHSPPMPRPRSARKIANCHSVCDSPHAAVNTE